MENKNNPQLEQALHQMEVAATNFALRFARMADVRIQYLRETRAMSESIRAAVNAGEMSAKAGAKLAHGMRNQILEMSRSHDFDLGRSIAKAMKKQGLQFEEVILNTMKKLGHGDVRLNTLTSQQQRDVFVGVIESAGRPRAKVSALIPRLRWAARGLWVASIAIAGYNIGTAEDPVWQAGREYYNVSGGFIGGAATGAAVGIWAGPIGVGVGILVGGALGALLGDRTYVNAVGVSDPVVRVFVDRYSSFWRGVHVREMAQALANQHLHDPAFVIRVFNSLYKDYTSEADDVARAFTKLAWHNANLNGFLRSNPAVRDLLTGIMREGWYSGADSEAVNYLSAF